MAVAIIFFAAVAEVFAMMLRLEVRNLSSNLGHQALLLSSQRLTKDLESATAGYSLVNWRDGVLHDVTEGGTGADALSNSGVKDPAIDAYLSTPANGVKFRRLIGPGLIASSIATRADTVEITMSPPNQFDIPNQSDLLYIPLLSACYRLTSVNSQPLSGTSGVLYTLKLANPVQSSVTLTSGSGKVSAYILKRSAYAVVNQALYYFPTIPDPGSLPLTGSSAILARWNLVTTQPFSLVYSGTTGGVLNNQMLRTLLTAYDTSRSRKESTDQRSTVVLLTMPRATTPNASN